MLNDLAFFANDNTMRAGLSSAQQAFKTFDAYQLLPSAYSGKQDVSFSDHFMVLFRGALSSTDKCYVSGMSKKELEVYYRFLDKQNGIHMFSDPTMDGKPIYCQEVYTELLLFCHGLTPVQMNGNTCIIDGVNVCAYKYSELDMVVEVLDDCLMSELACVSTCNINSSYDSCTSTDHTWNSCN